jgi:hypothetical protein
MQLFRFERKPQRLAGTDEMGLPYDLIQRPRPKRFGQRKLRRTLFKKIIHG